MVVVARALAVIVIEIVVTAVLQCSSGDKSGALMLICAISASIFSNVGMHIIFYL